MNDQNTPKQKTEAPAPASGENLPDPEYKVGPRCPPKEHRFKKKALEDALNKKVPVKSGERQVLVSKAVIGIEQLVNQFAKGDRHARRDLMDIAAKLGVDLPAGQKGRIEEALSVSHQAILDSYLARRPRPALAPPNKVIAPPELLDGIDMPAKTTRPVNRLPPKAAADPK